MDKKIQEDSDIIFTAISTSSINNFKDAEQIITFGYVPDMSFSREGISHALKRLKKYYQKKQNLGL